jgi:hypothetical protein
VLLKASIIQPSLNMDSEDDPFSKFVQQLGLNVSSGFIRPLEFSSGYSQINQPSLLTSTLTSIEGKRKRSRFQEHPESDNSEDNGDKPKRQRANKQTNESFWRTEKFACPYYKRAPHRYRAKRRCSGRGWDTIHRLKQVRPLNTANSHLPGA